MKADILQKFRNNTVESFNIVFRLVQQIRSVQRRLYILLYEPGLSTRLCFRCYKGKESDSESYQSTNSDEDSTSELKSTVKLLRSFNEAFTCLTGIVTVMAL